MRTVGAFFKLQYVTTPRSRRGIRLNTSFTHMTCASFLDCFCIPGQCLTLQAMVSSYEEDEQHSNLWLLAQKELQCALNISRVSASRDPQLEADILYLKGMHS